MENIICQTCLSKNRLLIPLEKIRDLMQAIHISEINDKNSGICWECHYIMLKYYKFKLQVRRAQDSINFMEQESQCLSNLCTTSKNYYDYEYTFFADPLIESEIKMDIKLEDATDSCDDSKSNSGHINENKPDVTIEVFVDLIKAKNERISNENCNKSNFNDTDNINDCFETPNSNCNSDIELAIEHRSKVKKERKKIKDRKSKKIKKEKESQIDDIGLEDKFYKVMYSIEEMQKHREEKRIHPNFKKIPFKCDSCVLGFTRKDNLEVHIEKKHKQSYPFTCDVCLSRFPNKRLLTRHVAAHFARYRCSLCPYEARELWRTLSHCRLMHKADAEGSLHCPHCDMETKTQEDLSEHIRTQHVLYCNECGEKFKGKNTLRTHKSRIHGVKREFVCEICRKTFKTKSRLESHTVTHNPAIAKKLSYCAVCDVQYKNIYVYRNHIKTSANHSERSYPCPACNKKFVSKVYWTKHYNFYHLQKSKYNCDICNKIFISDWRLKLHKQTQHGLYRSRDHPCNICGKKFFTSSTLRSHQLTHSARRSFMCEDCGDTFKQSAALYTHARLVHRGGKRKK